MADPCRGLDRGIGYRPAPLRGAGEGYNSLFGGGELPRLRGLGPEQVESGDPRSDVVPLMHGRVLRRGMEVA